jgi:pyrroloquinoline quinone biosynthesis protein D
MPRGVRLHEDRVRKRWVLLAPERAIDLDPIGHAILLEIDGARSIAAIVQTLAEKYAAPADQINGDVIDFVAGLCDRRILEVQT